MKAVSVALTFDLDIFSAWIQAYGHAPSQLSRGEFDIPATDRLVALMDEYQITSTFFVPGHSAVTCPEVIDKIVSAGHEVALHGWVHEVPSALDREQEAAALHKGLEAIEATTGSRPYGYRAPGLDLSVHSVDLLIQLGFEYDSSMMASDFNAYFCRTGDIASIDKPFQFGPLTELVELPVSWHLDDAPYFEFIIAAAPQRQLFMPGLHYPAHVFEIWREEFDYLHDEIGCGIYVLTLHPYVIARGSRIGVLRRLIEHMLTQPNTEFTSCRDYSRVWRQQEVAKLGTPEVRARKKSPADTDSVGRTTTGCDQRGTTRGASSRQ